MIKLILKHTPYKLFAICYYKIMAYKKNKFFRSLERKKIFNDLNTLNLSKYKKSDKLFVIGSGYSLNSISKDQWNHINGHDIFGFNLSILNKDHIPTYYSCEALSPTNLNENKRSFMGELYHSSFNLRKDDYKDVIKVVSDLTLKNLEHFINYGKGISDESLYFIQTAQGLASNEEQFGKLIDYYKSKGIFDFKEHINELFKFRATLCLAISFGINMGYKEIILCGIDLNKDIRYFFQNVEKYPEKIQIENTTSDKHSTIVSSDLFVTVDVVIDELNKKVCEPKGIKLYIQNPDSGLNSILDVYNFNLAE